MYSLFVDEPQGKFQLRDQEAPKTASGLVLVRILAACVNPLDTKIHAGAAAHARQPLPAVLGLDMAGIVEEVGEGVKNFAPGDEVFGMVGGVGGRQGTLSELIAVPEVLLAHKPRNLTMHEASALPLVTITAWEGLMDRARVQSGHKVLVHAGAGGVGHVVIQLAKSRGADVFATVSQAKTEIVERFGATPIDRATPPDQYLLQHTDGAGFDIIYDTLGGVTLDASFQSVKRYTGHVVSCLGWGSHSIAPLSFRGATYSGVFTLLPLLTGEGMESHGLILREASALAEKGELRPLLAEQSYTPRTVDQAFQAVVQGVAGKVVVDLTDWKR